MNGLTRSYTGKGRRNLQQGHLSHVALWTTFARRGLIVNAGQLLQQNLTLPFHNNRPHAPRAGPGRGHIFQAAQLPKLPPIPERMQIDHPSADCNTKGWLQQLALKKQWQTRQMERMEQQIRELEHSLAHRDAFISRQAETIQQLRTQV